MGARNTKTLKPEDLAFLRRKTKFSKGEIKQWHRSFIKDCPSGGISEEKFKRVYGNFFREGSSENFCHHVFRSFDRKQTGKITFVDFLQAVNMTLNHVEPKAKLEWAFLLYDIDGNGKIDKSEMEEIMQAIYDMIGDKVKRERLDTPKYRTDKIFAVMDKNNDDVLSKEEFIEGCMKDKFVSQMLVGKEKRVRRRRAEADFAQGTILASPSQQNADPALRSTSKASLSLVRVTHE